MAAKNKTRNRTAMRKEAKIQSKKQAPSSAAPEYTQTEIMLILEVLKNVPLNAEMSRLRDSAIMKTMYRGQIIAAQKPKGQTPCETKPQ